MAAAIPSKASTSTRPGASAGISHQHQHISEWHGMAGNESIKHQAASSKQQQQQQATFDKEASARN
jgi:hypothetical protein